MADESAFREMIEGAWFQRVSRVEEELRACVRDGFRGVLEVSGVDIFAGADGMQSIQFCRHEKMPHAASFGRLLAPSSFFALDMMTDKEWASAVAIVKDIDATAKVGGIFDDMTDDTPAKDPP